jgi:hypothetical protein
MERARYFGLDEVAAEFRENKADMLAAAPPQAQKKPLRPSRPKL